MAHPQIADLTTNTTSSGTRVSGPCTLFAEGTFGGGTLTVKVSRTSTSEKIALSTTYTAAAIININMKGAYYVWLTLAGATGPDLDVFINSSNPD